MSNIVNDQQFAYNNNDDRSEQTTPSIKTANILSNFKDPRHQPDDSANPSNDHPTNNPLENNRDRNMQEIREV